MICYKDKTFCAGGTPRCAMFSTCPRALTEDIWAKAKAAGLLVSQYIAPTAMPCYREKSEEVLLGTRKGRPKKTEQIHQFKSTQLSETEWRKLFEETPRRADYEIAQHLDCSHATVRNMRLRFGYPPARPLGVNRNTLYTEADALRLIKAVRPEDKHLLQASRRLGLPDNTAKHLRDRFRETFNQHGL